ncbi:hypothetical protein ASE95_10320 [Sphingomonas sp. Leaf231]|nr:hypothetical protein ASE95_10320 [Sphingomonas sp. Leaf231]
MKKIVLGVSAAALALSLGACGSKTTANDSAVNADFGNEIALNDALPVDENASTLDNAEAAALPSNAVDGNDTGVAANAF